MTSDQVIRILGIETSCDETAASVYHSTAGVESSVLHSQIPLHAAYGGVVPELASRSHIEKINVVVQEALAVAGCTSADISGIAVTTHPGLPGSLLVGIGFAKAIAYAWGLPIVGVNHLEGHIFSVFLEHQVPFPYLCLTASGGHTALYYVTDFGCYELIGETLDDAAGEAFDKIAKVFGAPYPGGPIIEAQAQRAGFADVRGYPRLKRQDVSFSFSGLKTAIMYDLIRNGWYDQAHKKLTAVPETLFQDVASSLLVAVGDQFVDRVNRALSSYPARALAFVGGVACNQYLRDRLARSAQQHSIPLFWPSPKYCTDNGAMIAYVGAYRHRRGERAGLDLDLE